MSTETTATTTATTETTTTKTTETTTKTHKVIERVTRPDRSGFLISVPKYDDDTYETFMERMADYLGWED